MSAATTAHLPKAFTLKFALAPQDGNPEVYIERLIASGCDDALIGIGQRGRIAVTREGESAVAAILSAIQEIKRAIPGGTFVEATPDLVGLSDIAFLLGFTRQYMQKLADEAGPQFPLPVHDSKRAIWHLETVLRWLAAEKGREIDTHLLQTAIVNRQFDVAKEQALLEQEIPEGFESGAILYVVMTDETNLPGRSLVCLLEQATPCKGSAVDTASRSLSG